MPEPKLTDGTTSHDMFCTFCHVAILPGTVHQCPVATRVITEETPCAEAWRIKAAKLQQTVDTLRSRLAELEARHPKPVETVCPTCHKIYSAVELPTGSVCPNCQEHFSIAGQTNLSPDCHLVARQVPKCLTEEELRKIIADEWDNPGTLGEIADQLTSRLLPYLCTREMLEDSVAMRIWEKFGGHEHNESEDGVDVIEFSLYCDNVVHRPGTQWCEFGVKSILAAARELFASTGDPELGKMLEELK